MPQPRVPCLPSAGLESRGAAGAGSDGARSCTKALDPSGQPQRVASRIRCAAASSLTLLISTSRQRSNPYSSCHAGYGSSAGPRYRGRNEPRRSTTCSSTVPKPELAVECRRTSPACPRPAWGQGVQPATEAMAQDPGGGPWSLAMFRGQPEDKAPGFWDAAARPDPEYPGAEPGGSAQTWGFALLCNKRPTGGSAADLGVCPISANLSRSNHNRLSSKPAEPQALGMEKAQNATISVRNVLRLAPMGVCPTFGSGVRTPRGAGAPRHYRGPPHFPLTARFTQPAASTTSRSVRACTPPAG